MTCIYYTYLVISIHHISSRKLYKDKYKDKSDRCIDSCTQMHKWHQVVTNAFVYIYIYAYIHLYDYIDHIHIYYT